jgi:hypothetical protein
MSGDKAGELVSAALIGAATAYVLYVCYPNAVQSVKDKIGTLLLRDVPENDSSTTTKVPIRKVRRRKTKSSSASSGCGYPSSSNASITVEEEEEEEIEWEEKESEVPSSSSSFSSSGFDFERFIFTSEEIDKLSAGTIVLLNEEVRNLLKILKEIPQNGFITEFLRPAHRVLSKSLPGSPKSTNARTTKGWCLLYFQYFLSSSYSSPQKKKQTKKYHRR